MVASCGATVVPSPTGRTTAPAASTSLEPADPSASIVLDGTISWQLVADPQGLWTTAAFENLRGAVPFGGGMLVYGHGDAGGDAGTQEAVIWQTSDLQTWTARSFDKAIGTEQNASIKEIAGNDRGLVAIGDLCCPDKRAFWYSLDGVSWSEWTIGGAAGDPKFTQLHGVAAARPGFVIVGEEQGSAAVWFSADGTTWARTDDLGPGTIRDVAPFATGFIAVGRLQDEPGAEADWDAAVWVSEDGLSWTRFGATAKALMDGDAELGWVVPFDGGVWVLGHVGEHRDRLACPVKDECLWGSEATWVGTLELDAWQGPSHDAPRTISGQSVIASRGGLLTNDGDALGPMLTSEDGLAWERWPASQPFPEGGITALAALTDSTVVAVGNVHNEGATMRDGAIWIGTYAR